MGEEIGFRIGETRSDTHYPIEEIGKGCDLRIGQRVRIWRRSNKKSPDTGERRVRELFGTIVDVVYHDLSGQFTDESRWDTTIDIDEIGIRRMVGCSMFSAKGMRHQYRGSWRVEVVNGR